MVKHYKITYQIPAEMIIFLHINGAENGMGKAEVLWTRYLSKLGKDFGMPGKLDFIEEDVSDYSDLLNKNENYLNYQESLFVYRLKYFFEKYNSLEVKLYSASFTLQKALPKPFEVLELMDEDEVADYISDNLDGMSPLLDETDFEELINKTQKEEENVESFLFFANAHEYELEITKW